jgi:hypothetical protein
VECGTRRRLLMSALLSIPGILTLLGYEEVDAKNCR